MAATKMSIRFYPVGNGDSALIENDDGKHLMIDYNSISEAESDGDDRIFKIAHHCSHTALNKDEKGDLITEPVEKVRKLFEEHGNEKAILIASCTPIPSMRDRNETGPPHYQAAEYYHKIRDKKSGKFKVTMEQPKGPKNLEPIAIEITKYGPRIDLLAIGIIGAGRITSTKSERQG